MSGRRPWQLSIWQSLRGAPMFSLGIHVDFHTPTVDLHLPGWTVQAGRNGYWGMAQQPLGRDRTYFGGRVLVATAPRWSGHTDNCDHAHARLQALIDENVHLLAERDRLLRDIAE